MTAFLAERPLVAALFGALVAWAVVLIVFALVLHGRDVLDVLVASLLFSVGAALFLLVLAVNTTAPTREYPSPRPAKRGAGTQPGRYAFCPLPLAVALQPDFDAFLSGFEVGVASGFVMVVALVVVYAVKKIVSF